MKEEVVDSLVDAFNKTARAVISILVFLLTLALAIVTGCEHILRYVRSFLQSGKLPTWMIPGAVGQ